MGLRLSKSFSLGGLRYTWGHTFGKGRTQKAKKTPPLGCGGCLLALASPFLLVIGCGVVISSLSSSKPKPVAQTFVDQPAVASPVEPASVEPTPQEADTLELTTGPEATAVDPFREWSSHAGKFKVDAVLVGLSAGVATLERRDGKRIRVPVEKLSDVDREYLKHFQDDLDGKCVGVSDGDTITVVDIDKKQTKIRLEGIDAPESHQDFGTVSREHIAKLIFQKDIRVQRRGTDKYGRTLGHVFVGDVWVNLEQVKAGLAWHYKKYSLDSRLADAEKEARWQHIGIWSRDDALAPWEFRHKPKSNPVAVAPKPPPTVAPEPPSYTEPRYIPPSYDPPSSGRVHVKGYTRKDGTYVPPHTRSAPRRRK
jgi:endonuclease YncB( thermonuclease family)